MGAILRAKPPVGPEPGVIVLEVNPDSAQRSPATPDSFNRTFAVMGVVYGAFDADSVEVDIPFWTSCSTWAFAREDSYLVGKVKRLPDGRSVLSPIGISWRARLTTATDGRGN